MPQSVHPRVQKVRRIRLAKILLLLIVLSGGIFFWRIQTQRSARTDAKGYTFTIDDADYALQCSEKTVGECLRKENIIVYEKDYLWPEMTTSLVEGMHIIVRRAVPITFVDVVGESRVVYTYGTTVKDVVNDLEIDLNEQNRIAPALETWIEPEMKIQLFAEREEKLTRTVDISFTTQEKKDGTLVVGKREVEQKGVVGKKTETYQMIYLGDELKEKKLLSTEVLEEPQVEIVRVGTQIPTHTQTIADGKASFYSASFEGARTASGVPLRTNELVAAHRTLPFGSMVKVTNITNDKSVIVKIVDRGPYVSGRVIDLTPFAFQQIGSLSSGILNVRLDLIVD